MGVAMKQIIVFETAEEIVKAFYDVRTEGDKSPFIPLSVYMVRSQEDDTLSFEGEGADKFQISSDVTFEDFIRIAFHKANIRHKGYL